MRIVSLLPSATEIVCALGARGELVGRSHECDFPHGLDDVPVLTSARIGPLPTSKAIDRAVRDVVKDVLGIYEIDVEELRLAKPDVIVTQSLCDVCAVSFNDVRAAVARLATHPVTIINLAPMRLDDIWGDIRRVSESIRRREIGKGLLAYLNGQVAAIADRAKAIPAKPRVLSIEWIDPLMVGGMWMPELITMAGGKPLVTEPAQHAPTLTREQLARLDPEVVVVKPCGFPLERTLKELDVLREVLPWDAWRAVAEGRVYVADGNAFFNRPGPRIVESLEIMAACVHPEEFADLAAKHRKSVVRIEGDLASVVVRGAP